MVYMEVEKVTAPPLFDEEYRAMVPCVVKIHINESSWYSMEQCWEP